MRQPVSPSWTSRYYCQVPSKEEEEEEEEGLFKAGGARRASSLTFRYRAQGWSEHQRPLYQRVMNVLNLERKECVCQRLTVEGLRGRVHTHKADRSVRGSTLSTQNCIQAGSCPHRGLGHVNKHNSESGQHPESLFGK